MSFYVIWSIEHTAWWRPGSWGYTRSLPEAGRYTRAAAATILAKANLVAVNECLIPVEALDGVPVVMGGDGPPDAPCLLCGHRRPLAVWYGGTRHGVCEPCRSAAAAQREASQ